MPSHEDFTVRIHLSLVATRDQNRCPQVEPQRVQQVAILPLFLCALCQTEKIIIGTQDLAPVDLPGSETGKFRL